MAKAHVPTQVRKKGLTLDDRPPASVDPLVKPSADQVGARGIALSRGRVVREHLVPIIRTSVRGEGEGRCTHYHAWP